MNYPLSRKEYISLLINELMDKINLVVKENMLLSDQLD